MDQQQLREHLEQLSKAIEAMSASDEEKDKLEFLVSDLERQIDDPLISNDQLTLSEEVNTLISSFERDHPTVSGILNQIMLTLSSMGV